MKDILFLNYHWVPNSTYIFKSLENTGYTCDFIGEEEIKSFVPDCEYKVVFAYLHGPSEIPIINNLLETSLKNSFFIQHDDTDSENINQWFSRSPDLIMHRELTQNTNRYYNCPIYPMHFPIPSVNDMLNREKDIDVCFIGAPTNIRRNYFVEKLVEVQKQLNINWAVKYSHERNIPQTMDILNRSKIVINYPGNSYDSWRIWEAASAGAALLQPKLPLDSTSKDHMFFEEYVEYNLDCSDLKEKIEWLLDENRWMEWGHRSLNAYENYHSPENCFIQYYNNIIRHAPLERKLPVSLNAIDFYLPNRL
jgi:hypothetical protein